MHEDIKWFLGLIAVIVITAYVGWSTRSADTGAADGAVRTENAGPAPVPQKEKVETETRQAEINAAAQEEARRKQLENANAFPLKGKLLIRSVSRGGGEYVLLEATRDGTAPVPITGLQLQAVKGRLNATVGAAWRLPFPGTKGDGETVFLKPGEIAYIISGRSANGMSFQLNSCTGYFEQGGDFTPGLPVACPHPSREPLPLPPNELSEDCLNYVDSLPACTTPSIPPYLQTDGSCQAHLSRNINYDSCVSIHKNEPNFFKGDWRIYLNRGSALWQLKHDAIELLDQNGKIISSYVY